MIRPATEDDIPAIVELGRQMHAESPEFRDIRYVDDRVAHTMLQLINGLGVVFLYESDGEIRGGMAGALGEFWFSDERYASDLALFIHPEHRHGIIAVKLALAFISWAKLLGARRVQMGVNTGVNIDGTCRLFNSLGMVDCGHLFKKDFT